MSDEFFEVVGSDATSVISNCDDCGRRTIPQGQVANYKGRSMACGDCFRIYIATLEEIAAWWKQNSWVKDIASGKIQ